MKSQILLAGKLRKVPNILSAEIAQIVVKVRNFKITTALRNFPSKNDAFKFLLIEHIKPDSLEHIIMTKATADQP